MKILGLQRPAALLCALILTMPWLATTRLYGTTPPLQPTGVIIITRDQWLDTAAYSVGDALRDVAGIHMEKAGSRGTRARARIRGMAPDQLTVLLDGHRIDPAFDHEVDFSQIPLALVERLEVSRGGGSLAYGPAAPGATVHIITSRPDTEGLRTRLGTLVGRDGVKEHHGRFRSRSHVADATYLTAQRQSSGFSFNEYVKADTHFGNVSRSFLESGFWGVGYLYNASRTGLGGGTPVPQHHWDRRAEREPVTDAAYKDQIWQRTNATVGSPDLFGGRLMVDAALAWRNLKTHMERYGPAGIDQKNRFLDVQSRFVTDGGEIGVRQSLLRREIRPAGPEKTVETGAHIIRRWGASGWLIQPAARYDRHSESGGLANLRLTGVVRPAQGLTMSANANRLARPPRETFRAQGTDPAFWRPERHWSLDTGVAWEEGRNRVALTGFFISGDEVLFRPGDNARTREETIGAETDVQFKNPSDRRLLDVTIRGRWTALRGRVRDGGEYVTAAMTPTHLGSIAITHVLPRGVRLTNEARFRSGIFTSAGETGTRLPGHGVWNMRFSATVHKAEVFAAANNLLQRRTSEGLGEMPAGGALPAEAAPQPERTFWAGITIKFDQ